MQFVQKRELFMKKQVINFSLLLLLAFMAHGMVSTQAVPFLMSVGYNSVERGYILSFYAIIAVIGQFLSGYLSDRFHSVKRFFVVSIFVVIIFNFLTFFFEDKNFMMHFLFMGNLIGFIRIADNLLETWIIEVDGLYPSFGKIRALGSLGWAVTSLLSGYLIVYQGYDLLMWVSVVINIIVFAYALTLKDANKKHSIDIRFSDIKKLFLNKNYVLLLLVYGAIYLVTNADSIAVTDLLFSIGAHEAAVGKKWFVQAMMELPLFITGAFFFRRFKAHKLMMFGTLMLGLRFVLYAIFPKANAIIAISSLQGLSFPFILLSQKELILNETSAELRSSGQMVFVALTSGLSAIISPIIAGYLASYMSIQKLVFSLGIFTLIPFLLLFLYQEERIT